MATQQPRPTIKATFTFEKETRNSIRYSETSFTGIGNVYLPKPLIFTTLGKAEWPKNITMEIDLTP